MLLWCCSWCVQAVVGPADAGLVQLKVAMPHNAAVAWQVARRVVCVGVLAYKHAGPTGRVCGPMKTNRLKRISSPCENPRRGNGTSSEALYEPYTDVYDTETTVNTVLIVTVSNTPKLPPTHKRRHGARLCSRTAVCVRLSAAHPPHFPGGFRAAIARRCQSASCCGEGGLLRPQMSMRLMR